MTTECFSGEGILRTIQFSSRHEGMATFNGIISDLFNHLRRTASANRSIREQLIEGEVLAREVMRRKRAVMRRAERGFGGGSQARSGRNRHIKAKSRAFLKEYRAAVRRNEQFALDVDLLDAKFRPSVILDSLLPSRAADWKPLIQRPVTPTPETLNLVNFSFLDDPASALRHLKEIARVEGSSRSARLNFKDQHCEDAGAYLVLAEVWPQLARVFVGGEMHDSVQHVLSAIGVSEHNSMHMPAAERAKAGGEKTRPNVWAYPLQRRRPANTSQSPTQHLDSQAREKAADRFSNWLDECLGRSAELELTTKGKAQLALIMGEALCNAERHSQPGSSDGEWSITAFMEALPDSADEKTYKCMIAFLSVGQSISESLATAHEDVRSHLRTYLSRHRGGGISPDTLATVFALQDTITCDPAAREQRSGGTGLQDILDFVTVIGGSEDPDVGPRITIVSGRSCLRLHHPYIRGERSEGDPTKPRLLWFNPENVMDAAPDPDYVFDLPERLAGTLVTIAFTIDQAFLARQLEVDEDGVD